MLPVYEMYQRESMTALKDEGCLNQPVMVQIVRWVVPCWPLEIMQVCVDFTFLTQKRLPSFLYSLWFVLSEGKFTLNVLTV